MLFRSLRAFRKHLNETEVVIAHNGVEVMDFLNGSGKYQGRDPAELPQVLLLDLKMPMMDGLETLKRIRSTKHARLLPVVVMTSSDEQRDQIESYQLGANSYVRKPVKFDDFLEATRQLGVYWLNINKAPPPPNDVVH